MCLGCTVIRVICLKTLLPRSGDCVKPCGGRMIEMAVSELTRRLAITTESTITSVPCGISKNSKKIRGLFKHWGLVENEQA